MFFVRSSAVALVCVSAIGLSSCNPQSESMTEATNKAEGRRSYVQQNDIEFQNYDRRQRMSDDPSTIIWCTSAYPFPGTPLFTIPVVGKLTSGGKRPFPTSEGQAGPDGMYGSSGEYRYGFTPAGTMVDFYGISTFCTTEPTVWQRENTTVVMAVDPTLARAQAQASAALKRGDNAAATRILSAAVGQQ